MKKNLALKIIIPAVMVIGVFAIWIIQSGNDTLVVNDENANFPLSITEVNLEELSEHNLPIIIDFGADECIPCIEMAPVLAELNAEMQDKAIVQFVDVWQSPQAAEGFPVQVIPTQIFINADGTPYIPSDEVSNEIRFLAYQSNETDEHIFTAHQGGLTEEQMRLILADMGV